MPEPEKKNHAWVIIAVIAAIAYFFVAARPLGREFTLTPKWVAALGDTAPSAEADGESLRAFELNDRYGYFTESGKVLMSAIPSAEVAVSAGSYAEYGAKGEPLVFRKPDGKETFTVEESGFPAFVSGRLFLVKPDNAGLAEYSASGQRVWSRDFGSVLTCFDANSGSAVAGGLDGKLSVIGTDGTLAFDFSPGGSRVSVILGCAVSADSSMIAMVCGIDKQRFILLEKRNEGYRVAYHEYLPSDFRRRAFVDFSEDGEYVFYEKEGGLSVLDVGTRKTKSIAVPGNVRAVRTSPDGGLFLILSSSGDGGRLMAVQPPDTVIIDAPFSNSDSFLDREGESIFLGGGGRIVRIEMGNV